MARLWQIRQSEEPSSYGMGWKKYETEEEMEAYDCGYKDGYADAMEEVSRIGYRSRMIGGHREEEMDYRRRRDSRGRYM